MSRRPAEPTPYAQLVADEKLLIQTQANLKALDEAPLNHATAEQYLGPAGDIIADLRERVSMALAVVQDAIFRAQT